MKILFLSKGDCPDYMRDMVYHGLMTNTSITVEEPNPCNYMHTSFAAQKGGLYGRGFTIFARLDDALYPQNKVSIDEMLSKIRDKYYDYIIYGSIHRYSDHLSTIAAIYDKSKILIIDGEDHPFVEPGFAMMGTYFKRELQDNDPAIRPISFAIPKELIVSTIPSKVKWQAHIIAGDRDTYIFNNEEDYFRDYQNSVYGHTKQKGGWDCCRHYEILMNGGIPYFENLEHCPPRTMVTFPKTIIELTNKWFTQERKMEKIEYDLYISALLELTRKKNTTEALIQQIL